MILNLTNILYVIFLSMMLNQKFWYFYNCVQHVLCNHGFNMLCFNVIYLIECQMKNKYLHLISLEYIVLLYLRFRFIFLICTLFWVRLFTISTNDLFLTVKLWLTDNQTNLKLTNFPRRYWTMCCSVVRHIIMT